jgi:hypothetical protein
MRQETLVKGCIDMDDNGIPSRVSKIKMLNKMISGEVETQMREQV